MQGKKRRLSEAQKWYFRLMNDPKQFEKERFIGSINEFNRIIKEFEKLYDETPTTDHLIRDEILYGIEQSERDLAEIHAEHEMFKKYKARTAISR